MGAGAEGLTGIDHDLALAGKQIEARKGRPDDQPIGDHDRPEPALPLLAPIDGRHILGGADLRATRRGSRQ